MRLGFVGVGKHAQKMAAAFRECGADVIAYDRENDSETRGVEGFGEWRPWQEMIEDADIDAIVCCASPDVTTQVVAACLEATKPCCATKPLMWYWPIELDEADIAESCIYVDLWRLYSPAWLALKADLRGKVIKSVHVDFYGNGPVRETHSGLLDYGPHALAFLLDLGLNPELIWRVEQKNKDCGTGREQWTADGYGSARSKAEQMNPMTAERPVAIGIQTGNGWASPMMYVRVDHSGGQSTWCESADGLQSYLARCPDVACGSSAPVLQCSRDLARRAFCRAFLAGEPSDTLRISCEAMRLLRMASRQANQ